MANRNNMAKKKKKNNPGRKPGSVITNKKGGKYHYLPKAKKPKGITRYGHQGSGFWGDAYHNEHYARSGRYGKEGDAKKYRKRMNRASAASGASLAGLGAMVAFDAKKHPKAANAAAGFTIASAGYSAYQQSRASKMPARATKTRYRPSPGGYYYRKVNGKTVKVKKGKRGKR